MNTRVNVSATEARRSRCAGQLFSKLILVLAAGCVGAGLLLPVMKGRTGTPPHRLPGQWQADARTVIAGVCYLLRPELPEGKRPVMLARNKVVAQPPPARTLVLPELSCNQTSAPAGPLTNMPVQI